MPVHPQETTPARGTGGNPPAQTITQKNSGAKEPQTATAHPRPSPKEEPPSLDLLSFSLLSVSKIGAPSPIRNPIQIINWRTDKNANEVLLTHADSDQVTIQRFGEDVIKNNPDFVLSFEGN